MNRFGFIDRFGHVFVFHMRSKLESFNNNRQNCSNMTELGRVIVCLLAVKLLLRVMFLSCLKACIVAEGRIFEKQQLITCLRSIANISCHSQNTS